MTGILTRDDIIDSIREVIARLRDACNTATIQIIGGAPIALTIDEDRPATVDVDESISPVEEVRAVCRQIAENHGWPFDWVNDRAKILLSDGDGRAAEWVTLCNQDGIRVQAPLRCSSR